MIDPRQSHRYFLKLIILLFVSVNAAEPIGTDKKEPDKVTEPSGTVTTTPKSQAKEIPDPSAKSQAGTSSVSKPAQPSDSDPTKSQAKQSDDTTKNSDSNKPRVHHPGSSQQQSKDTVDIKINTLTKDPLKSTTTTSTNTTTPGPETDLLVLWVVLLLVCSTIFIAIFCRPRKADSLAVDELMQEIERLQEKKKQLIVQAEKDKKKKAQQKQVQDIEKEIQTKLRIMEAQTKIKIYKDMEEEQKKEKSKGKDTSATKTKTLESDPSSKNQDLEDLEDQKQKQISNISTSNIDANFDLSSTDPINKSYDSDLSQDVSSLMNEAKISNLNQNQIRTRQGYELPQTPNTTDNDLGNYLMSSGQNQSGYNYSYHMPSSGNNVPSRVNVTPSSINLTLPGSNSNGNNIGINELSSDESPQSAVANSPMSMNNSDISSPGQQNTKGNGGKSPSRERLLNKKK